MAINWIPTPRTEIIETRSLQGFSPLNGIPWYFDICYRIKCQECILQAVASKINLAQSIRQQQMDRIIVALCRLNQKHPHMVNGYTISCSMQIKKIKVTALWQKIYVHA